MMVNDLGEVEVSPVTPIDGGEQFFLTFNGYSVPVITFYQKPERNQTMKQAIAKIKLYAPPLEENLVVD